MISLKDWMDTVEYKITEGGDHYDSALAERMHSLSAWNGVHGKGGWSCNVSFTTDNQEVAIVEACDYTNDRAYRWINPNYRKKFDKYVKDNDYMNQAWDDVNYIDLETEDDWLEKASSIVAGEDYDTRIKVPVDFTDKELLRYMKMAHEMDITFNQLVERAISTLTKDVYAGTLTKKEAKKFRKEFEKRNKNLDCNHDIT